MNQPPNLTENGPEKRNEMANRLLMHELGNSQEMARSIVSELHRHLTTSTVLIVAACGWSIAVLVLRSPDSPAGYLTGLVALASIQVVSGFTIIGIFANEIAVAFHDDIIWKCRAILFQRSDVALEDVIDRGKLVPSGRPKGTLGSHYDRFSALFGFVLAGSVLSTVFVFLQPETKKILGADWLNFSVTLASFVILFVVLLVSRSIFVRWSWNRKQ